MLKKSLFTLLIIALMSIPSVFAAGHAGSDVIVFATPTGGEAPAPAFPGEAYKFTFSAHKGDSLHLSTMLVQSNDWFFSPNDWGIPLYDSDGMATNGDVTDYIHLYDAGTEVDEKPGEGPNQAPRQAAANSGPIDSDNNVRRAHDDFGVTPAINQLIKATLTHNADGTFTLSIENISGSSTLPSPIAPGVAYIGSKVGPLFTSNNPDRGMGLEALAEDGNPAILAGNLMGDEPVQMPDVDAMPTPAPTLPANNAVQIFAVPTGGEAPAPAFPGEAYEFSFNAKKGESLHLATMLVQTNDWFFSPNEWGIPLYDNAGTAKSGDMTDYIHLFDAGTEADEKPGAGANQAPRQPAANTGPSDSDNNVRRAHDDFGLTPSINQLIKATLTHTGDGNFIFRIENVSGSTALPGPIAPGVAYVGSTVAPLFNTGNPDRGLGLEAIAEDGNPMILAGNLQ